MGKFERKMQNEVKQNMKSFEEWQEENAVEFVKPIKEVKSHNWAKIGKLIVASATSLVVVIGATIFAINETKPEIPIVNNSTSDEILEFAEHEIHNTVLQPEEYNQLMLTEMNFDLTLQYSNYTAVRTIANDKLVFAIVYGEIETENDYYLLTFKFHIDERYNYIDKPRYEGLANSMSVGEYSIWYEENPVVSADLITYDLKIVRNDTVCYLEMQCFENDFNGFIELLF